MQTEIRNYPEGERQHHDREHSDRDPGRHPSEQSQSAQRTHLVDQLKHSKGQEVSINLKR